ncbi:MAG: hypothetical protein D6718_06430 [Acidobacteria bacterium]|nr:MAG: hypothetical protein D6718_06430 [Acidobacteriota bacterium]
MPSHRPTPSTAIRTIPILLAATLLPAAAGPGAGDLQRFAIDAGLAGDDLSAAFDPARSRPAPEWLRARPGEPGLTLYREDPPVRVHVAPELAPDADLDGVPDRAAEALSTAARTLELCRRFGLGSPADDGDGELDLYLADLGGAVRGYVVPEARALPGRGSSGFAVVDASLSQPDGAFRGMIARAAARLVFLGRDASAPLWWLEPSVTWVEARVAGPDPRSDRILQARWTYPERGPFVGDPLLARGNVSLLWALRDESLEGRALAATWSALARREDGEPPEEVVARALERVTGLSFERLVARAATVQIVSDLPPTRFTADVGTLPVFDRPGLAPVRPGGAALVRVLPDPRQPEGTRLRVQVGDDLWSAFLLARRQGGGWDRAPLPVTDAEVSAELPWNDYDAAVLLLVRRREALDPGPISVQASAGGRVGPYALSAVGARRLPGGLVEIRWHSAWERGLFGWMVERSASPDGPWTAVAGSPVPAIGLPREGSGYSLLDSPPDAEGLLYYRVVAVTRDGLRITAPAIAVPEPR